MMMKQQLYTILVMLMAIPTTALTEKSIFSLNETMTMDIGDLFGQKINLDFNKKEVDEFNTIYKASCDQTVTFPEITGIKPPSSMHGMTLSIKYSFTVQETKKINGSSFKGKISVESQRFPLELVSIPFSGETNQDSFTLEIKDKSV